MALVEFALVLPLTLILVLGILDFGKAFNFWITETHQASTGARFAVVNKNPGEDDGLTLQQYIKTQVTQVNELATSAQVCIGFPDSSSDVGDPVRVTVAYEQDWLPFINANLPLLPDTTMIESQAIMRLEAPPSKYSAGCA